MYRLLLTLALLGFTAAGEEEKNPWTWTGDLRLRTQLERQSGQDSRWSEKIRARFGVHLTMSSKLRAEIRLASAKSSRSTNQTLGDNKDPGPRRRFIGLDLAYADWHPVPFAKIYLGRFPQVHFRPGDSQVVLDDDLTLEGAALVSEYEFIEQTFAFANFGSSYIRENYDNYYSEELADNMLNWGQVGLKFKGDTLKVTLGAGFFNFVNVQGKSFSDLATGGEALGNTEDPAGVVAYPYLPRQYFMDLKHSFGETEVGIFGERVINNEVSARNSAWWTGLAVAHGKWDGQVSYGETQANAVPALFTNSDFGNGRTGVQGLLASARWKFAKNMAFRISHFDNRIHLASGNVSYIRDHFDLTMSF